MRVHPELVRLLVFYYRRGYAAEYMANIVGLRRQSVSSIANRKTYTNVPDDYTPAPGLVPSFETTIKNLPAWYLPPEGREIQRKLPNVPLRDYNGLLKGMVGTTP